MNVKTISYSKGRLKIIDQRSLPQRVIFRQCASIKDAYYCIETLAIRGAPAIGVFAAYALYIGATCIKVKNYDLFYKRLSNMAGYLKSARPTAVNLSWALDRMLGLAMINRDKPVKTLKRLLLNEAKKIHQEDEAMCEDIGNNGARLIKPGDAVLTHCNAGALATAGIGTALAVIYSAKRSGKRIRVYADETRPLLQGARLTAWELKRKGIDVTLICDNTAASLMSQGRIDKIIVGADRIASNGDFANKIGTYGLAVLAKEHRIPFYVAAPSSTFDLNLKGGYDIPIEERAPDEVRNFSGVPTAPKGIEVYNPAFDVTPHNLVSAIITEKGLARKPYRRTLKKLIR